MYVQFTNYHLIDNIFLILDCFKTLLLTAIFLRCELRASPRLTNGLSEVPPILPLCLLRTTISSSRVSRANILPYSTISPSCFKKKTNLISIQRHQVKYGALPNLRVHISLPQEYLGSCHLSIISATTSLSSTNSIKKNVDYSAGTAYYLILKIGGE